MKHGTRYITDMVHSRTRKTVALLMLNGRRRTICACLPDPALAGQTAIIYRRNRGHLPLSPPVTPFSVTMLEAAAGRDGAGCGLSDQSLVDGRVPHLYLHLEDHLFDRLEVEDAEQLRYTLF